MAFRLPAYLHRNRYGTLYLRLAVPVDLRPLVGRAEIYRSLGTASVRDAADCALTLRATFKRAFELLQVTGGGHMDEAAQRALQVLLEQRKREAHRMEMRDELEQQVSRMKSEQFQRESHYIRELDATRDRASNEAIAAHGQGIAAGIAAQERIVAAVSGGILPTAVASDSSAGNEGMLFSDLFEQFCKFKEGAGHWRDPVSDRLYRYGPVAKEFIACVGDVVHTSLDASVVRKFKQAIIGREDFSQHKKGKWFEALGTVLRWATTEQYVSGDLASILQKPAKKGSGGYEPFSDVELKLLFESEDYKGNAFSKASQYWIPLIGLYTGARITEIAQLHLSDVRDQEGIWLIDINDNDIKKLKSESATRTVPIHPNLISIGLLRYHQLVKDEGFDRLFPDVTRTNRAKDSYGADPSEHFTGYRRKLGVTSRSETFDLESKKWKGRGTKVFHSLRDTANSKLRHTGVTQERRERLVGHASHDVNNKHYRPADINQMFPLSDLLLDIKKLDYGLVHAPYVATAEHRRERQKGAKRQAEIDATAAQ